MTILPLIERELKLQSRKPALYGGRLAAGLVGAFICALVLLSSPRSSADPGGTAFWIMVSMLCFLALLGFVLTCDSIAREQREGTLGLLLLTHISPVDVVLGKFSTVGLGSLSVLASVIPVTAVCVAAGGITGGEVFRSGLALASLLTLSLSAGVWSSVKGGSRLILVVRSMGVLIAVFTVPSLGLLGPVVVPAMCLGLLFGFQSHLWKEKKGLLTLLASVLIPLAVIVVCGKNLRDDIQQFVSSINPFFAILHAEDSRYIAKPQIYWESLTGGMLMTGLLILGAAKRLGSAVREDEPQAGLAPAADSSFVEVRVPWPRLIGMDPMGWLLRRRPGISLVVWIAAVLVFFGNLATFASRWAGVGGISLLSVFALFFAMVPFGLFAWVATDFGWTCRQSGALELVCVTPLGRRGVADGYWTALTRVFQRPVWTLMVLGFLRTLVGLSIPSFSYMGQQWEPVWLAFTIASAVASAAALWMMMRTLCAVGSWRSLRAKTRISAVLTTLALVVVCPWIISLVAMWLLRALAMIAEFGTSQGGSTVSFITTFFAWSGLLMNILHIAYLYALYRYARRAMQNFDTDGPGLAAFFKAASFKTAPQRAFAAFRSWGTGGISKS